MGHTAESVTAELREYGYANSYESNAAFDVWTERRDDGSYVLMTFDGAQWDISDYDDSNALEVEDVRSWFTVDASAMSPALAFVGTIEGTN